MALGNLFSGIALPSGLQGAGNMAGAMAGPIWNGPPQPTMGDLYDPTRKKKFSKLQIGLYSLAPMKGTQKHKVTGYYFNPMQVQRLIDAIGFHNPIRNGRPTKLARTLLEGIPAPVGKEWQYKLSGLMYCTPYIVGIRREKCRTSMAALGLLRYWQDKHPKFRAFAEPYMDNKAVREIQEDCVDLALGMLPQRFRDVIVRNEHRLAVKQAKEAAQAREEAERQRQAMNPQSLQSANQQIMQRQQSLNQMNQLAHMMDDKTMRSQLHHLAQSAMYPQMINSPNAQRQKNAADRWLDEASNVPDAIVWNHKKGVWDTVKSVVKGRK